MGAVQQRKFVCGVTVNVLSERRQAQMYALSSSAQADDPVIAKPLVFLCCLWLLDAPPSRGMTVKI